MHHNVSAHVGITILKAYTEIKYVWVLNARDVGSLIVQVVINWLPQTKALVFGAYFDL